MNDPSRWARLEALFDRAVELPPADRRAWITEQCGEDRDLADQLLRMLAAHERTGPLDRPPVTRLPEEDVRERLARALADRYVIDEALGSGGMAVVFRAHELKHQRSVVIKVLQPGLAAAIGPGRFSDEVRIAARLSHPHILALIDSGEADGLLYYVMPYVGGTSLRERLDEDGASSVGTAITVLRDIADALAHAHDAGVIHRDLKPENVLCVGAHAFLIDFGVAKLEADARGPVPTDPGLAVGTPGYMAPEQAAGQPVDHRSDIYVWGLLAREMLTGRRGPGTDLADRPEVPRTLVALVEAALALDPDERPTTARALVAALDGMLIPAVPRPRWPWLVAAAAATLVVGWLVVQRPGGGIAIGDLAQPIAVAPLHDETGDSALAGLGRLAGDWITQGLHEAGGTQVVAWPAARAAVEDVGMGDVAGRLRDVTGARSAVIGSIYLLGDTLRLQAEIVDTRDGIVLAAPAVVAVHRDSAMAGVRQLRDRVMGALAVRRDERLAASDAFATRPPTYAAYRLFDRALDDYDGYRYADARAGMLEAWRLDTTFSAALVYAAHAAWNEVNRTLADSLVRAVLARRAMLSDYHVAMAEQMGAALAGDTPAALLAAQRAVALAPGSRARYNAAQSLLALNRPAAALAQLDSLDPDRGPMRGWPAYWSQRAYNAHLLGDHAGELADAVAMAERHPSQRVPGVIAARALAAAGRLGELDSTVAAHDRLDPDVYWSQGAMRVVAGEELTAHGRPAEGQQWFAAAERWLRERLAIHPEHEAHRYWLASSLIGQRNWSAATSVLRGLLRDDPDRLLYRGMMAVLLARAGQGDEARRVLGDADPADRGEWLVFRARIAVLEGDREAALALLGDALRTGVDNWHWTHGTAFAELEPLHADPRFARLVAVDRQG